jgi:hypothetical protein
MESSRETPWGPGHMNGPTPLDSLGPFDYGAFNRLVEEWKSRGDDVLPDRYKCFRTPINWDLIYVVLD